MTAPIQSILKSIAQAWRPVQCIESVRQCRCKYRRRIQVHVPLGEMGFERSTQGQQDSVGVVWQGGELWGLVWGGLQGPRQGPLLAVLLPCKEEAEDSPTGDDQDAQCD